VAERVRFEVRNVAEPLPAPIDVITTFDVVHDAADPLGLLRSRTYTSCVDSEETATTP
jgi:hypothetical protein